MAVTSRSDALYAVDFRQKLAPLNGPGSPNFSRAGAARLLTAESKYAKLRRNQYRGRWTPIDLDEAGTLARRKGLLLERGVTPVNDDSVLFDSGSAWGLFNESSSEAVASVFDDLPTNGEARRVNGDGSNLARFTQSFGTLTGSKEAALVIYENVSERESRVGIFDQTDNVWVIRADYDWNNDSVSVGSGSGTVAKEVISESGPNGGKVVAVVAIGAGTSGNDRDASHHICPKGNDCIIHHAHHVELAYPTSPILFVGSPQSRIAEEFFVRPGPQPEPMVGYLSLVPGTLIGDTGDNALRAIGHGGGDPRLRIFEFSSTPGQYRLQFRDKDGNTNGQDCDIGASDPNQHVELAYAIRPSDGFARLVGRSDTGSGDSGGASPSSWTEPSSWGEDSRVVYNENEKLDGTNRSRQHYLRHHVVLNSSLDTDPFTGTASDVLDELAGIHFDPTGRPISLNT